MTTASFDRPAIFREAWQLARAAAASTGLAISSFIGNSLRAAWRWARADLTAAVAPKGAMVPQVAQQQQARAFGPGGMKMKDSTADACRICGKPLSDPLSRDVGMGPVCRIASKLREVNGRQQDLFGNERSSYTVETRGDVICVTDLDRGRTVTTDADRVIDDLVECHGSLVGKRVIYRDSMGVWDEIVVSDDRFTGFRSVGERNLDAALRTLVRRAVRAPVSTASTLDEFLSGGAAGFTEVASVVEAGGHITEVRFPVG
jgi:hypothetical protein